MGIPFPEDHGGGGADTLAYTMAIEELARVDSSVAITVAAHTSLGTMPIYLWGSDEQKDEWLPVLCRGQKLACFGLTEPEAGSDAGNTSHHRGARRRRVGDQRRQAVHHQLRHRDLRLRDDHRGHRPRQTGAREISNLIVPNGTPGYEPGEPYRKMGWNASDTRPLSFDDCRVPGVEPARPPRRRLQAVHADPRRRPDRRLGDGRRARAGRARRGDRLRQGAARLRPADLQLPGDPGEDRRPLGPDRGGAPAHLPGGDAEGPRASRSRSPRRRRS